MSHRYALAAAALAASFFMSGCAVVTVAGVAAGAAVGVASAVVGTGVAVAGKVVGAGVSAVTPGSSPP